MEIFSTSEEETVKAARVLAKDIKGDDVILLHGNLGAGKSVFARALILTLSENPDLEVPSPTFTLVQTYDSSKGDIYHFDLYRLKNQDEIYELGWEDCLGNAIVIIEWPERLENLKPNSYLDIKITTDQNETHTRKIEINRIP